MERLDKAALNALQPPDVRNESSLASTLKTLLFFTALMITVPIGLYFTTKSYVFEGIPLEGFLMETLLGLLEQIDEQREDCDHDHDTFYHLLPSHSNLALLPVTPPKVISDNLVTCPVA
ncbi:vacuolar ATPase assembly integral membrane protein VMA21 isoform X1 [Sorex fumeus]|uniref:vacuolar ATPase assembly integral membrane protein VMA21 isoform X1 n=1 Tax=Sorex fumeus TaxID=62283 RepID=UPI0024AD797F|nr:vacuolar ATPase assembly integral membrane protein VMA21 isoform X1 [Sorex fumeus]